MQIRYIGMMHESKGQHIGKALSLQLFHITIRQHPEKLNLLLPMQLLILCISISVSSTD